MSATGRLARLAALVVLGGLAAAGCGTVCDEAAQICADQGRSKASADDADPVECEGKLEAQAECIADAESCAPDVVEACWKAVGGDDEDEKQGN